MNHARNIIAAAVLLIGSISYAADVRVYFSPSGGCTAEVVAELAKAKSAVLVQAYSFTSPEIADALIAARGRGVAVQVILDRGQRHAIGGMGGRIVRAGIPTKIDAVHAIAHNKIIVIDNNTTLTGSFNFTVSAELHNAENLVVIVDPTIAKQYADNWHVHDAHSKAW